MQASTLNNTQEMFLSSRKLTLNSQEYSEGKALPPQICPEVSFILRLEIRLGFKLLCFLVSQ